jgi:hypothetical protein
MSAESDLYQVLTANAGVTAALGSRVFPEIIAQGETLPALAFSRTNTRYDETLQGKAVATYITFQLQCWGPSQTQVEAAMDAVLVALQTNALQRVPPQSRSGTFDPEIGLFGSFVDIEWHETAPS